MGRDMNAHITRERRGRRLPLAIKIPYSAFVAMLVPVYAVEYGPWNFLWFSDIGLLVMVVALWRESALLASMTCVGFLLPELAWVLGFLLGFVLDAPPFGITGYMFDPELALHLRALSLFHLILPPLYLWSLHRLGYDRRAPLAQIPVIWFLLLATYLFTDPKENINWAFGLGAEPQDVLAPEVYLALMFVAVPVLVVGPTHVILRRMFPPP